MKMSSSDVIFNPAFVIPVPVTMVLEGGAKLMPVVRGTLSVAVLP